MKTLFVTWQDPETGRWIPVGRLTGRNGEYRFGYTRGAQESKSFVPFGRMQDLGKVYCSEKLFPLFANRVLARSRPEFPQYLQWLGLSADEADDLELLARSGGQRATDTLEIVQCPEPTPDNNYEVRFFAHGLRYLAEGAQERIRALSIGDRLFVMRDIQNRVDPSALLLRTDDPLEVVGYVPRYFSAEFSALIDRVGREQVKVSVEQVNSDAPSNFRLRCLLRAPWPADFAPCAQDLFQPLVGN